MNDKATGGAAQRLAEAGIVVEEDHPDLSEEHQRQVLRAYDSAIGKAHLLREITHLRLGPSGTLRKGLALMMGRVARNRQRGRALLLSGLVVALRLYPGKLPCRTPVCRPAPRRCAGAWRSKATSLSRRRTAV